MKTKSVLVPIQLIPIWGIFPSPENDKLYRPIDPTDLEIIALAESIKADGVQEPLLLTRDHHIISGHRRFASGKLAGLDKLPCRIREDIAHRSDEFMRLLRECNRQRIKSVDEIAREEVITSDPTEAYQSLIEHRRQKSRINVETMDIGGEKCRAKISAAKMPFLNAVRKVLSDLSEFLPLSDRKIHYELLNNPPLIHSSKKRSIYRNDKRSYRALTDLLTRARLTGLISHDAIGDESRPITTWSVHRNVQGYIRDEVDGLLKGFFRDLLQSQPNHIELMIEKNTLVPIVKPVAMEFCLPMTSGHGMCSVPPRKALEQRFRKSQKDKLVLLLISDFDPAGQVIAQSFARSMRDDFQIENIEAIKVAVTHEQIERLNLPPGGKAKPGSPTYADFVKRYGEDVYEVEAIPARNLQAIVRSAIDSVLDVDAFNAEIEREKHDWTGLEDVRRRMLQAVKGVA